MGNKNTSPPKGPETGTVQTEEGVFLDSASGVCGDGLQGPSAELLASLQSLGDNSDYSKLPHSLHQIAMAYSHKKDFQWAIQFLHLEKLYHERLITNLTTLQEDWESQWKEKKSTEITPPAETDTISQKHIETLSQICTTHHKPSVSMDQNELNKTLRGMQTNNEKLQPRLDKANKPESARRDEGREQNVNSESQSSSHQSSREEEDGGEEENYEEGREVEEEEEHCEETPEEEEVKVEWPTGVPQASDKELAKLSHKEGNSSPDGLVSILKRRRASLDGLPPPALTTTVKQNAKRKVRFSEPDDGIEQDEVGGDSCLILLLLCLVTVVISIGGTALYCTLVDTYSNICTDFNHNVEFYVTYVRRFFEGLGLWLPFRT